MAPTQLESFYRLSVDQDTHVTKKDVNSSHTLNHVTYVTKARLDEYSIRATRLRGHKQWEWLPLNALSVAYWREGKTKGGRYLYLEERKRQCVCKRERVRERGQIDRKSHCDSKQSQITLVCVSHGTSSSGSEDTVVGRPLSSRTRWHQALISLSEKISRTKLVWMTPPKNHPNTSPALWHSPLNYIRVINHVTCIWKRE